MAILQLHIKKNLSEVTNIVVTDGTHIWTRQEEYDNWYFGDFVTKISGNKIYVQPPSGYTFTSVTYGNSDNATYNRWSGGTVAIENGIIVATMSGSNFPDLWIQNWTIVSITPSWSHDLYCTTSDRTKADFYWNDGTDDTQLTSDLTTVQNDEYVKIVPKSGVTITACHIDVIDPDGVDTGTDIAGTDESGWWKIVTGNSNDGYKYNIDITYTEIETFTVTKSSSNADKYTVSPSSMSGTTPLTVVCTPISGYAITDGYIEYDGSFGDDVIGTVTDGVLTIVIPQNSGYSSGTIYVWVQELSVEYTGQMIWDSRQLFSQLTLSPAEFAEFTYSEESGQVIQLTPNEGYRITDATIFSDTIDATSMNLQQDGSWTYTITPADNTSGTLDDDVYNFTVYCTGEAEPTPSTERVEFYTIYEPTNENMQAINNAIFIDSHGTIDTLNYFISYKKFFCNIPTDGTTALKAGKFNFNILAPYVNSKIIEVDCGSIDIDELYEDILDYSPYTQIRVYLPFCGFEYLDVEKLMGHTIHLKYQVDVMSGRCLAQLFTDIVSPETCYYQFAGTIAADEPLSQANTYYKGGYELLTSNMLGELQPFVVVSTAKNLEGDVADYEGLPSAEVVRVGDVTGYIRYKSIFASRMTATESEKAEIEQLLKQGVFV